MDSDSADASPDNALGEGVSERALQPAASIAQRWLSVAQAAWILLAALLAALFLMGIALYYSQAAAFPAVGNFVQESDPATYLDALRQLGLSTIEYARLMVGLQLAFMLGCCRRRFVDLPA